MIIKKLETDTSIHTFEISDTTVEVVNALRRIILSEMLSYAVESIDIIESNGVMNVQTLAHRLAMCPLFPKTSKQSFYSEEKKYNFKLLGNKSDCKSDLSRTSEQRSDVLVTVDDPKTIEVTTSDITVTDEFGVETDEIRFMQDIPITKLKKGQILNICGIISRGIAKTHAKYSIGQAWYSASSDNHFNFFIKLDNQELDPTDILKLAVDILIKKLELVVESIA